MLGRVAGFRGRKHNLNLHKLRERKKEKLIEGETGRERTVLADITNSVTCSFRHGWIQLLRYYLPLSLILAFLCVCPIGKYALPMRL